MKKNIFCLKVTISKNMKFFKIFLKNFKHPILSPPSPQMLYIKYEDFSEDRMEIVNDVIILCPLIQLWPTYIC